MKEIAVLNLPPVNTPPGPPRWPPVPCPPPQSGRPPREDSPSAGCINSQTIKTTEIGGEADLVRKVQSRGVICFRGREWPISQAFRGQPVALRATTTDGLWQVYFGVHRVATVDLRVHNESS